MRKNARFNAMKEVCGVASIDTNHDYGLLGPAVGNSVEADA
jgi:hypothetical protein